MKTPHILHALLLFALIPAHAHPQEAPTFPQLLQKIASEPPDTCTSPALDPDTSTTEATIFNHLENAVTESLNHPSSASLPPLARAEQALASLEQQSARINASWPDEDRLHHQLLEFSPALVLKLTFRSHARFFVYAIPEGSAKQPNHLWQAVGSDNQYGEHDVPNSQLEIYPLHRGPSGAPRFLASFNYTGCAGNSYSVHYQALQWDKALTHTETIIDQKGAFGLDQAPAKPTTRNPFPSIGTLRTTGTLLQLPYCWFSGVDFWDNPTLCALDTYDLSADQVAFHSRAYNRPELVPLAKAIEYAELHDFPATRAYTSTDALARRLVRDGAPHSDAGISITRLSPTRCRINMNSAIAIVEKRNHRWLITRLQYP